jgi:hypothetical protein
MDQRGKKPRTGKKKRSVHVGFVENKVALGQVFPRVLRFSPANFIPSVLHYLEKRKKMIIFLFIFNTGLHNKPTRLRCVRNICFRALHKKNASVALEFSMNNANIHISTV